MRRIGYYDELINDYSSFRLKDELWDEIRRFQIEKAEDNAVYDFDDVRKYYHPETKRPTSAIDKFLERMGIEDD